MEGVFVGGRSTHFITTPLWPRAHGDRLGRFRRRDHDLVWNGEPVVVFRSK